MTPEEKRQKNHHRRVLPESRGEGVKVAPELRPWNPSTKSARTQANQKIYNSARWKKLRALVLDKFKICTICNVALAEHADHILPHRLDPALLWDINNLTGLCPSCHASKREV